MTTITTSTACHVTTPLIISALALGAGCFISILFAVLLAKSRKSARVARVNTKESQDCIEHPQHSRPIRRDARRRTDDRDPEVDVTNYEVVDHLDTDETVHTMETDLSMFTVQSKSNRDSKSAISPLYIKHLPSRLWRC